MGKTVFWVSIAALAYTYIGYPVTIWLLSRIRSLSVEKGPVAPSVSVVVACNNEAAHIEDRINNLLESDYPRDRLEIVIISDGSTDSTAELAGKHEQNGVRVFAYNKQMGKATALNVGVEIAAGEIIVFADARQRFEPGSIRRLVSNFASPRVGAVSGELMLERSAESQVGDGVGLYWKYEKWTRKSEARFGSMIGATGAIYAIRRSLWQPLPAATILDDVFTPMQIALSGHRVVFEERACAYDRPAGDARTEFRRKVRTLAGNYQLCQLMPRVLAPTGWVAFQFYCHKLARLAAPILLMTLLCSSFVLAARNSGEALYRAALLAQVAFYASVLSGWVLLKLGRRVRLLNFAYVFSVMNAAALVGLFYFLTGKRNVWARQSEQVRQ